jgi:hypothetical protein
MRDLDWIGCLAAAIWLLDDEHDVSSSQSADAGKGLLAIRSHPAKMELRHHRGDEAVLGLINAKRRFRRKIGYESEASRLIRNGLPRPAGCVVVVIVAAATVAMAR